MADIPRTTRISAASLAAATLAVMAATLLTADPETLWERVPAAVVLFAMILLAERLDVAFPQSVMRFHVSVSAAFAFAAGLTAGPLLGGIVAIVAHAVDGLLGHREHLKTIVNATVHGFCAAAAGIIFIALAEPTRSLLGLYPSPLGSARNFGVLVLAALVFSVLNSGLLALIVAPVVGTSAAAMWRSNIEPMCIEIVTLVTLGGLIPVLVHEALIAVVLLIVPLFAGPQLAFRGMRQAQVETRATMEGLVDALEQRDAYTHRHSIRVAEHVRMMLDALPHLPRQTREAILAAARVHDLGKVGTRDESLQKPGALTVEERREMERHTTIGAAIVANLEEYRSGIDAIRHHHERWDGTGYPDGQRGEEIPLGARLIAIADAYDAMTTDRVYRKALDDAVAIAEIERGKGIQFDPALVDLFTNAVARRAVASRQARPHLPSHTETGAGVGTSAVSPQPRPR